MLQLVDVLRAAEGVECASRVVQQLEEEWQHLVRMRQRYCGCTAWGPGSAVPHKAKQQQQQGGGDEALQVGPGWS